MKFSPMTDTSSDPSVTVGCRARGPPASLTPPSRALDTIEFNPKWLFSTVPVVANVDDGEIGPRSSDVIAENEWRAKGLVSPMKIIMFVRLPSDRRGLCEPVRLAYSALDCMLDVAVSRCAPFPSAAELLGTLSINDSRAPRTGMVSAKNEISTINTDLQTSCNQNDVTPRTKLRLNRFLLFLMSHINHNKTDEEEADGASNNRPNYNRCVRVRSMTRNIRRWSGGAADHGSGGN